MAVEPHDGVQEVITAAAIRMVPTPAPKGLRHGFGV